MTCHVIADTTHVVAAPNGFAWVVIPTVYFDPLKFLADMATSLALVPDMDYSYACLVVAWSVCLSVCWSHWCAYQYGSTDQYAVRGTYSPEP